MLIKKILTDDLIGFVGDNDNKGFSQIQSSADNYAKASDNETVEFKSCYFVVLIYGTAAEQLEMGFYNRVITYYNLKGKNRGILFMNSLDGGSFSTTKISAPIYIHSSQPSIITSDGKIVANQKFGGLGKPAWSNNIRSISNAVLDKKIAVDLYNESLRNVIRQ